METQPNSADVLRLRVEDCMLKIAAPPARGLPSAAPGGSMGEGALGLLGPDTSPEGHLDHAANSCPPREVIMSQRGDADRPADEAHQEPQQLPPTQRDSSGARGRRRRRSQGTNMRFHPRQLKVLKSIFQATQYPAVTTRRQLARDLDVAESRLKVWFKNERAKCRKIYKEELLHV
ncbi:rhox homeobox family member 1-like isoform X2 [Fukomys damarensis]|uniref:rhox homeobox family member 1-like isoform X2 n=1 Tax=Fukomys damarensis TaxID=885580 RepID=UPI00053FF399|nr:rhox homeobox family member 1-like isoform X2 [Fukomys damarensis]